MNVAKQKDKAYVLDIYLRKLIGFHGQKVSYCNCRCHHCSKSNGWIVFKNKYRCPTPNSSMKCIRIQLNFEPPLRFWWTMYNFDLSQCGSFENWQMSYWADLRMKYVPFKIQKLVDLTLLNLTNLRWRLDGACLWASPASLGGTCLAPDRRWERTRWRARVPLLAAAAATTLRNTRQNQLELPFQVQPENKKRMIIFTNLYGKIDQFWRRYKQPFKKIGDDIRIGNKW